MQNVVSKRRRIVRWLVFAFVYAGVTALLAGSMFFYGWTSVAHSLPELSGWHREAPPSEFTAADARTGYTFDDFLEQESRVFAELEAFVKGPWTKDPAGKFCRFRADSVCNPETIADRNWNRTFVLKAEAPKAGALLVHGLSDSPYSLRALGERLHNEGFTVIGLRVPGHGTCPGALARTNCEDWAAAVRVAVRGLRDMLPEKAPLVLVGYSNGGALSMDYTLASLDDPALPRPDAVVLFSPMIGINPLAKFARLYRPVASLSGLKKVEWASILAEVDPYKYSSWPTNASVQAWDMTRNVERRLAELQESGHMGQVPPILTFQSVVDSTVRTPDLITVLFDRLAPGQNELVLFDVNRKSVLKHLIDLSFEDKVRPALKKPNLPYMLTIVTNANEDSTEVIARTHAGGSTTEQPLGVSWPKEVFSLSHVAPPIAPDDPVYGTEEATKASGLPLGSLSLRGEQGALTISDGLMVRLRHNPFYTFTEDHAVDWLTKVLGP